MTCGPWRPISLHTYTVRITDLRVQTHVSESLDADIKVSLHVSSLTGWMSVTIRDKTGQVVREADSLIINDGKAEVEFEGAKGEFELWYPVGYGKQPMYSVQVQVTDEVCLVMHSTEAPGLIACRPEIVWTQ
jgi:beta-mannosidase